MTASHIAPLGARIRAELEHLIGSGEWPPGHRVPAEEALARQYACSRMTVNKVLSGMAAARLIVRRRRAGSFVAHPQGDRAVLKIQDFATEAAQHGLPYEYVMLSRRVEALAGDGGLAAGGRVLRVRCLHRIGGVPAALEERTISLSSVPAAEGELFRDAPPGSWLLKNVPWTEAEHVIRACNAPARVARLLELKPGAACLVLERRTWHRGALVTAVTFSHPAGRQRFTGRFSPLSGD
jgi:GntR family transcriptional regulator, histidine utilization repressor